jgi:hypothetical protein
MKINSEIKVGVISETIICMLFESRDHSLQSAGVNYFRLVIAKIRTRILLEDIK